MKLKLKLELLTSAILFFSFTSAALAANVNTDWVVDPTHSSVGFSVRHLVSRVTGNFSDFEGDFHFDPKKMTEAKGQFKVKVDSINTSVEKRDKHLKSEDFFDADKFADMTFVVKKLSAAGKNKYKMSGDLTLHGVTKPVTFEVEHLGTAKGMMGEDRAGFVATTKLNRNDFGMVWNKNLDTGGLVLGDDVTVNLNIEATAKPAAK